jgi:lysozyme family protein
LAQRDVKQISDQEVASIYYNRYWLAAKCDALRRKLDLAAFVVDTNETELTIPFGN